MMARHGEGEDVLLLANEAVGLLSRIFVGVWGGLFAF